MLPKRIAILGKSYGKCIFLQTKQVATKVTAENCAKLANEDGVLQYDSDQRARILQLVNKIDLNGLLSYDITKARANKLLAWQARNGPLKEVGDIYLVEGFGQKVVDRFYKSLLDEPAKIPTPAKTRARTAPFVTPPIDAEQQSRIRSCVSVRVGFASVTWARLEVPQENAPCMLTHWHHHDVTERKLQLHELVRHCLYIAQLIPTADCYLFEQPQTAQISSNPGSVDQQNINVQKAQLVAILSFALASRATPSTQKQATSNTFYLRRFISARLFNHLVGSERVSSEDTVLSLMRTYYNTADRDDTLPGVIDGETAVADDKRLSFRGNVNFPEEQRHLFANASRFQREFLGQTLLLNLAFVRLVLLKDEESVAKITRNTKGGKSVEQSVQLVR